MQNNIIPHLYVRPPIDSSFIHVVSHTIRNILKRIMNDVLRVLQNQLRLSENEAVLFVYLIKNGSRTIDQIRTDLDCTSYEADQSALALVDKGMIVQISKLSYMPLHPRFAIVNRYREKCREDNIPFHRNALIDSIGSRMEKYFEHTNV